MRAAHRQGAANALPARRSGMGGFTLLELVITIAILGLLASVAAPVTQIAVQRSKEQELRRNLWVIRGAIDAYRAAYDRGHILRRLNATGYPPSLDVLVEGVEDQRDPEKRRIFFLRRLPRDPLHPDATAPAAATWGKRSYASTAAAPEEGEDVFDVYSRADGNGLNKVPYRQW